jgi:DNA-binding HxlR family transcriptional regulator
MEPEAPAPLTTPPGRPRQPEPPGSLDRGFRRFGDRAGQFVRSIETLTAFGDDLGSVRAQPNLRIARMAFGKWSVEILDVLHPRRRASFGELRRILTGISSRVLSAKLKLLEEHGLVERTIVPTRPPRPEYALTERGQEVTRVGENVLKFLRERSAGATGRTPRRRRASGSKRR